MGPVMVLVLMVVPVVCAAGWTRDVFSEATLARKGLYADVGVGGVALAGSGMARLTREDVERGHRRTGDGFLEFSLMELFFATGDPEIQGLMDGLRVETEGRVVAEKVNNEGGTRMRLYRMFMTCCVADARAIPIVLEFGGEPPVLPENGWVRVGGRMTFPEEDGVRRAVLVVERAMAAEVPAEEKFFRQ